MATVIWKFVDTPVAVPATLLDMNSGNSMFIDMGKTFDISPPVLRKNLAQNMLSDGSVLTAAAYENRHLVFSLGLNALGRAGKAAQLKALIDELSKPTNLLMYSPDSTLPPVFFHTLRADDFIVDDRGGIAETWSIDCKVEAKPFAIGLRRDLAQVTVNNDPAAASGNKTFFDISGIVGDSPTHAFVKIASLGAGGKVWISTRAFNNPQSLTLFTQAEAATLGTDTTAVADVAASSVSPGTGSSKSQTTFVTNTLIARLTFNTPTGTDAAALRGRYRMVARVSASAAQNTTLRWKQSSSGDFVPGPRVSVDLTTAFQFVDLGVMEFPAPQMVPATIGYSGLTTGHAASPVQIEAQRNSGTGNLFIDYVYLLPADERLCVTFQLKDIPSGWICLDGPNDATYGLASGSTPFGATRIVDNQSGIITRMGGLPMLVPGVTQRWYTLFADATNNTTKTFDISYWPRWREVATV